MLRNCGISYCQIHSPLPGDKVDYGIGLSYWPTAYVAWRAGTTTLYAIVNFIPPVRDYEFGLRILASTFQGTK
jgi:hypothetical protein